MSRSVLFSRSPILFEDLVSAADFSWIMPSSCKGAVHLAEAFCSLIRSDAFDLAVDVELGFLDDLYERRA